MKCQVCGSAARAVFSKEANVSCGDYFEGRRLYPDDTGAFDLLECTACGFAWYAEFLSWTDEDFRQKIYNDDYHLCDAPFLEERPARLAAWLLPLISGKSLLDYGGGEGLRVVVRNEGGRHPEAGQGGGRPPRAAVESWEGGPGGPAGRYDSAAT